MEINDSPCTLVVDKSEVVLVKPSKRTPEVSLSLSSLDNELVFDTIVQTVYVFAPIPNHDLASLLQHGLSHALFYYYPLAGKIHRVTDDNKLQLNCKARDGVPLIKATAACTLSSLSYLDIAGDAAYQLVPSYDTVMGGDGYHDPLALQVTKFACEGITIGIAYYHPVCDVVGMTYFIRAMIDLALGKIQPSVTPVWDRERLTFNGDRDESDDFPEVDYSKAAVVATMSGDMVREILNITSEDITKLNKTTSEDEEITSEEKKVVATTLEVLAAHVWRARCRALNMSPDETTLLSIAFDVRNILEPPLPEGYYGNAISSAFVRLTARELCESSLTNVVRHVKDARRAALDKRYVLGQLSEIEKKLEVKALFESIHGGPLVLADWRSIGLHYDAFVNVIPLVPITMSSVCTLLPASNADPGMRGGVRLLITLPRDVMAKFKQLINDFSDH